MTQKPDSKTVQKKNEEKAVEFVPFGCTDKVRLTAAMVRQFIAVPTRSGALPSERDCIRFIMLCRGKRANPFEGDVFLIGYDSQNGPSYSMVCGLEMFLKRAEQNENYNGCESGIIVQAEAGLTERQGSILLKGETLIGGWCKVHRKDRNAPFYKTAPIDVYHTGKSRWMKDPAGMIEKVAKSQALREAFPTALGGLYTAEEMNKVTESGDGVVIAREPIQMPKAIDEQSASEAPQPDAPEESGDGMSDQEKFADYCSTHGVSFDDARDFLRVKLNRDLDSFGSFDELPTEICTTIIGVAKWLAELSKKFGKASQGQAGERVQ